MGEHTGSKQKMLREMSIPRQIGSPVNPNILVDAFWRPISMSPDG
jgi:hypothetical protein